MPAEVKVNLVLSSESMGALIEAMEVFGEIAKDYPDDAERFQVVADKVMDAVRLSTESD